MAGQTTGLRPSERRRLERLCHHRQPQDALGDLPALQRLAGESRGIGLPLTLLVDGRGLCRMLWVGTLLRSQPLLERLPGTWRRQGRDLRLLSCTAGSGDAPLQPDEREGIVALDLDPALWLRFPAQPSPGGRWPAALFRPTGTGERAWTRVQAGLLGDLCGEAPDRAAAAPTPADRRNRAGIGSPDRVLLLWLEDGDAPAAARQCAELEGLVRSAGGVVAGRVGQRRSRPSPQTIWGEGKLREAALEARRVNAAIVITDRELTPVQGRNLERLLDRPVQDRSELILDIFAQRASSAAGRLQVELAQLRYRLPRLAGRGRSLSRQGGGIGTRGPGETQLEKDRRAIARRIEKLQRDLGQLGRHRARLRRTRSGCRRLALVGYTNAGKSSLLNALLRGRGGEEVLAVDKLFATLDPTTRRVSLFDAGTGVATTLLITDTVGFIRDLPPPLMEAFRSTFEEALDADGLLIVINLADPDWPEQLATVHSILDSLGSDVPRLAIGNQIDRCPAGELERARSLDPGMVFISATGALGMERLRRRLQLWRPDRAGVPTSTV